MHRRNVLAIGAAALVTSNLAKAASQVALAADPFALAPLPYSLNALEPHISRETLEYHHGKHHKAYLDNLRAMAAAGTIAVEPLTKIIAAAKPGTPVHNNAAQAWNHAFFWNSMTPNGGGEPKGPLLDAIKKSFGGTKEFNEAFRKAALGNFGSGWTWLIKTTGDKLEIVNTSNAEIPANATPLLTLDVWEHAYYIDYRNARAKFVDVFLTSLVNWKFAADNFRG